ncbi:glycosyltransferase [Pseudonocardia kujensis]|uniref:glycosyltransferase n=1 Tax=Pseudonocardia kujensis TaxID=1128675 RepID=UPI001E48C6AB|nr:glycosyltransferase [Pseudonocardia kujensis]MCE0766328.1 glycosyltransferase [Pseudonocardia kujensis]
MRVEIVCDRCSPLAEPGRPGHGGLSEHLAGLGADLAAAGHEVTVLVRRDSPAQEPAVRTAERLEVRHVDAGPAAPLPEDRLVTQVPVLAEELERRWRAQPPDVVHAHSWTAGLAAAAAARELGLPFVVTLPGVGARPVDPSVDSRGRASAEHVLVSRADRVLASGEDDVFALVRLGARRSAIRVVPYGVDTATFHPDGPTLRRGEHPRLLAVAGLDAEAGVQDIIRALRTVPEAELLVAGGPRTDDPEVDPARDRELARLHAVAREAHVERRVRFLGAVRRETLPALLRSADALVHVPHRTGFGMVALEAMACGRAVVASAVGALAETVVDQVTGVLVPPGRPDALAHALRALLREGAVPMAFGIAGRDRAVSRYGRDRLTAAVEQVYREAAEARGTALGTTLGSAEPGASLDGTG